MLRVARKEALGAGEGPVSNLGRCTPSNKNAGPGRVGNEKNLLAFRGFKPAQPRIEGLAVL
jgi:hypothetical protein